MGCSLAPQSIYPQSDAVQVQHPRLVPVLLLAVTDNDWDIYFACDEGISIRVHGPMSLGPTKNLLHMFALLASLKAVEM